MEEHVETLLPVEPATEPTRKIRRLKLGDSIIPHNIAFIPMKLPVKDSLSLNYKACPTTEE